jgi:hypothetical protein
MYQGRTFLQFFRRVTFFLLGVLIAVTAVLSFAKDVNAKVSWTLDHPTKREDGELLPHDEIKEFIAYVTSASHTQKEYVIDKSETIFSVADIDYGCVTMITVDTDYQHSKLSRNVCKGPAPQYLVDLTGTAPEEETIIVNVKKPENAQEATLKMNAFDADMAEEGQLIIGNNQPIDLFGDYPDNDGVFADVTIEIPEAFLIDGDNQLLFTHVAGGGYSINTLTFEFTIIPSSRPDPPSLPID